MRLIRAFTTTCLLVAGTCAMAQDANLKKTLSERLPSLPKIEEISKTPMAGVFEIRVQGNEIFYTDANFAAFNADFNVFVRQKDSPVRF